MVTCTVQMMSPAEFLISIFHVCRVLPLWMSLPNAVTVSPSETARTWVPLTLMPTAIWPGQSANEPTPARFSASASEAPPLRNPKGCLFLSSTFMVAWSVSGSGVDIKCIPRVWERPSVFSILSIKCSIFIVLIPFWFCLKAKIQQIIEIGREKEEKIINKTKYAIKNEKRYLHPCKG